MDNNPNNNKTASEIRDINKHLPILTLDAHDLSSSSSELYTDSIKMYKLPTSIISNRHTSLTGVKRMEINPSNKWNLSDWRDRIQNGIKSMLTMPQAEE